MSWYILPSGQPWYATDGSRLAEVLVGDGATVLPPEDVDAAREAWETHTPGPAGHPADWATVGQINTARDQATAAAAAADLDAAQIATTLQQALAAGLAPDPGDGDVLVVADNGGVLDPNTAALVDDPGSALRASLNTWLNNALNP